jgi:hypothetical protein
LRSLKYLFGREKAAMSNRYTVRGNKEYAGECAATVVDLLMLNAATNYYTEWLALLVKEI